MVNIILILVLIVSIWYYKPSLDYTKEKNLLLWYGRSNRKYVKLW